ALSQMRLLRGAFDDLVHSLEDLRLRDGAARAQLSLGRRENAHEHAGVAECLVGRDVEDHRPRFAVLRDYHRPPVLVHSPDQLGSALLHERDGLDVLTRSHGTKYGTIFSYGCKSRSPARRDTLRPR